jgi:hypothetical protein
VLNVIDPDAARAALRAGLLACPEPDCPGRLRIWTRARPRRVRLAGGQVLVHPDRGRCRECEVTQVLLPAWCLPRRAYGVDVVGAALLAGAQGRGCERAAAAAGVPLGTVRGWLRAVTRASGVLITQAVEVAKSYGDPDACSPRTRVDHESSPLAAAVNAVGGAAGVLHLAVAHPRRGTPNSVTGIDYLEIISSRYHRELLHARRLADPTGAIGRAGPWELINVITAGRLLTSRAG